MWPLPSNPNQNPLTVPLTNWQLKIVPHTFDLSYNVETK